MPHEWAFHDRVVVCGIPLAAGFDGILSIGVWLMAAVMVAIGGMYVARRVRGWAAKSEHVDNFSLQELRDMRQSGRISKAEFDVLKRQVIHEAAAKPALNIPDDEGGRKEEGRAPLPPGEPDSE